MDIAVAGTVAVIAGIAGYLLGTYVRELREALQATQSKLKRVIRPGSGETTSVILEPPLTPEERVRREQEELLESINRAG